MKHIDGPQILLLLVFGVLVLVWLRWRRHMLTAEGAPATKQGTPAPQLVLGAAAVRPSAQWLLLQPGQ